MAASGDLGISRIILLSDNLILVVRFQVMYRVRSTQVANLGAQGFSWGGHAVCYTWTLTMYCGSSSEIRDAIGNKVAGLDLKAPHVLPHTYHG